MGQVSPRCAQMLSTANHALTLDVKLYFQFYLTHQEREEREGTFKMSWKLKKKNSHSVTTDSTVLQNPQKEKNNYFSLFVIFLYKYINRVNLFFQIRFFVFSFS